MRRVLSLQAQILYIQLNVKNIYETQSLPFQSFLQFDNTEGGPVPTITKVHLFIFQFFSGLRVRADPFIYRSIQILYVLFWGEPLISWLITRPHHHHQEDAICLVKSILLHCKSSELTPASLFKKSVLTVSSGLLCEGIKPSGPVPHHQSWIPSHWLKMKLILACSLLLAGASAQHVGMRQRIM